MAKKLIKHGNSLALIIDKPLLEILGIDAKTPLELLVMGDTLIIKAQANTKTEKERKAQIKKAAQQIMKEYAPVFKKLAKT